MSQSWQDKYFERAKEIERINPILNSRRHVQAWNALEDDIKTLAEWQACELWALAERQFTKYPTAACVILAMLPLDLPPSE